MRRDTDNQNTSSQNNMSALIISVLALLNGVFSAYVLNYKPKIGEYHIWLCTILGVLLALFTVLGVVWCVRQLKKKCSAPKITIPLMIITILMGIMWTRTVLPYIKTLQAAAKQ